MKLGLIGLGVMGRPMTLNLMKRGREMSMDSRRAESAAPLVEAGAHRYATPAELAAASEAIFTMVTTSSDVEEVVLGANVIIYGVRAGAVLIDMETIAPAAACAIAARLAQSGVDMIDAPVSGGPAGA